MKMRTMRAWGFSALVGLLGAACSGSEDKEEQRDASPEEACAAIYDMCPGFPLPEEQCVAAAEMDAPQDDLNCVVAAGDCHEALVECIGYSEDQYEAYVNASSMGGAGGSGN